ncbi:DUF1259 domain-containing protein [Bacillus sp. ISL-55]|uniref:DUF1259 domain-containing protein n=1 Tax=Bacillus sp. ISL-55 TaxID=2819134 RepID=UPI001BEC5523|nr:DUF1259 domain-containing protein [Bacillus sp. ISL-55]MBT2694026.1 DUF1259 domain-containing protein [Bacillus sp. ISL-55]
MKRSIMAITLVLALFLPAGVQAQGNADCEKLKEIFDTKVKTENGVCRVEIVRQNIKLTLKGEELSPEMMELAFHIGFNKMDGQSAVIGELALLQEEVNPVIDELRKGKLEISALHNHMMQEEPRIMYLHFQGFGDMEQQAQAIKAAVDKTSK